MSPQDAVAKMVKARFPSLGFVWLWLTRCVNRICRRIPADYGERRPSKFILAQRAKQKARLASDDMQISREWVGQPLTPSR